MRKIYYLTSSILMLIFVQFADAQNMFTKQIIVCSGGNFSDPDDFVTVAAISPENGSTVVFDTIFTQSVQDVITHNGIAYVAAQDSIVKYNLDNYSRLAAVAAPGIHKLALNGDQLIATFWYPAVENYVKIYSSTNLVLISEIPEVSGESDGVLVFPWSSSAVVAVPGAWGSTSGSMAWLDLENNEFQAEVDYGEWCKGISFFVEYFNGIPNYYAVTKTSWGDTTFQIYGFDLNGNSTGAYQFEASLSGFTGLDNAIMYAQLNGGIGQLDLANKELGNNLIIAPPALPMAASVFDTVQKQFYMTSTDYATTGTGSIYNVNGDLIGSFDVGIAAEAIAIDYRETTIIDKQELVEYLNIYPNPASKKIELKLQNDVEVLHIAITNISGQIVYQGTEKIQIDVSQLNPGFYFTTVETAGATFIGKFIKK